MNLVRDALLGLAIGDALGVPVEFKSRAYLTANPVKEMLEYGTHYQPIGTWSDDSSLTFCLADSLAYKGYDLRNIASHILAWFNQGLWAAHNEVFDIGGQTRSAIDELTAIFKRSNFDALKKRENSNEYSNGNGALMRILPLAFHTYNLKLAEKFQLAKEVGALTHGHIRSAIACLIYILFAEELIEGKDKRAAYLQMKKEMQKFFTQTKISEIEKQKFFRILDMDISNFEEEEIKSDGYVLHSLEASLWCLLRENNYRDTVLKAVNLGEDTDTTAAIAGGLAGLLYGVENIPEEWLKQLVRRKDIENLADRLNKKYFD